MEKLKQVKIELKKICKDINYFLKAELKSLKDVEEFEKRLKKLSTEILCQDLRQWEENSLKIFAEVVTEQRRKFGSYVAEFIKYQRENNVPLKELHNAWRVSHLKMMLKPETSSVKFVYNDQNIMDWKVVSATEGIRKNFEQATKELERYMLPTGIFTDLLLRAYEYYFLRKRKDKITVPSGIPIKDFYEELQVELFRLKLSNRKIKVEKLPLWAFLYNLDRYFANYKNIPSNKRIAVQSGSQHEIQKGMGMVLNGLNPLDEYKTCCYVKKG